jgi:hypothetical protein
MNTVEEIRRLFVAFENLSAAVEWYNEKVAKQETEKADLLAALRLCLPIMVANTEASHLTDGFRQRENENDRILARVKKVIEEAE